MSIKRGHTVGSHTMTHASSRKKKEPKEAIDEIEKGISAVKRAAGAPIAPFFRFPFLQDSPRDRSPISVTRNIAVFSMDVDSFDFKFRKAEQLVKDVMAKLDKKGKGILLMHDIQPVTAKAMPGAARCTEGGRLQDRARQGQGAGGDVAEYDALIEKDVKGLPACGCGSADVEHREDGAERLTVYARTLRLRRLCHFVGRLHDGAKPFGDAR